MHQHTRDRIEKVRQWLGDNGPIQTENSHELAELIGIRGVEMIWVLNTVRRPWWIETEGWTIPFVPKGVGLKTWSIAYQTDETALLRNGNAVKSAEVETHLRNNRAGLELEARLATGVAKQKAQILATTTRAAIELIDAIKP